jgi:hypothetical protein
MMINIPNLFISANYSTRSNYLYCNKEIFQ